MTFSKVSVFVSLISLAVIPAAPSSADVKIQLRNGRTITAENCEESAKGYVCYKMGGEFEVSRKDVISIKGSSGEQTDIETPTQQLDVPQSDQEKREEGKEGSGKNDGAKPVDAEKVAEKRFNEIRQRKNELNAERDKIVQEQKQLQEDYKKLPDWMPEDKHRDFTKRNAAFDEKMKKFNAEAEKLDKEEKKILEGQKGK